MCSNWDEVHKKYDWRVDLRFFGKATDYPGYFSRIIEPAHTVIFENKFRRAIDTAGTFEVAGEVCFWKNYKNFQARNRLTENLLTHLEIQDNWDDFVKSVKQISKNPSYDNFIALQNACGQQKGFAVPVTFLSFHNPTEYPMVDKIIAYWWAENRVNYGYGVSPLFSQRKNDGWIQTSTVSQKKQNWNAYIHWKEFCNEYAIKIAKDYGFSWRARDVEMAVWEAYKHDISLEILPAEKTSHDEPGKRGEKFP